MKKTAKAPANIAFIKYWGKTDEKLRLPANDSISMNLSNAYTTTTVEFSKKFSKDKFYILKDEKIASPDKLSRSAIFVHSKETERVSKQLDIIRKIAGVKLWARVVSRNNFPANVGIASSASGFAALTLAAASALNLKLSEKELSILARLGSGSAARSIPDGFVQWKAGKTSDDSYAYSLYDQNYWDLRDIIVIVSAERKKTSSTAGHDNAASSIFFQTRLKNLPRKIKNLKNALKKKEFKSFGEIIEQEAIELHTVMMTQKPPLFYWNSDTINIVHKVHDWRDDGLSVFFTIDAGPNMHLICEGKDEEKVIEKVKQLGFNKNIIINSPAKGARIISKHLF